MKNYLEEIIKENLEKGEKRYLIHEKLVVTLKGKQRVSERKTINTYEEVLQYLDLVNDSNENHINNYLVESITPITRSNYKELIEC